MKKIEIILKQLLLKLLLLLGRTKTSGKSVPDFSKTHLKILFIRLNRIGDALVSTPLLKLLKDNLDCEIEILADKKNHFIFENNPSVSKTLTFQKGFFGILAFRKYTQKSCFDVIVDLHDDVSTTVSFLVALAKVPLKFGLKKENKLIFTKTAARLNSSEYHVVERILQIAKLFGIKPIAEDANVLYFPRKESDVFAEQFLTKHFNEKRFLIGINISAGSAARFWGIENFKKLLQIFFDKNVNAFIISAPKDLELAKKISSEMFPVFSENKFDRAAAIVSKLNLLFTPDTSLIHIASAFKISVFGLYVKFQTEDVIWYPYKSKFEAVITNEPTFKKLTFSEVEEKFIPFLNKMILQYEQI